MNKELLRKYASLVVRKGANVQEGQLVVINGPVFAYEFIRLCVKEAYAAKAGYVIVNYNDATNTHESYLHANEDMLADVPSWVIDRQKYCIDNSCCFINVVSELPGIMADVDPNLIAKVQINSQKAMKPFRYYTMNNVGQWTICAYPNEVWASKIFPNDNPQVACDKLGNAILEAVRVDENSDAVDNWINHGKNLRHYCDVMNKYNFKALHFKNSLGTDLTVGLVENHIWCGGEEDTTGGIPFNANMPTEEVFTMPDCHNVNGKVVATKPLNHHGKLFEDFYFVFENGRIVDFDSRTEKDYLLEVLNTDEGSRSIGEVALIGSNTPINRQNILYYTTLFDENASCHLALGACYPTTMKDGEKLSDEELLAKGGNISMNHIDFMFGSEDMCITGITHDGEKIAVFVDGNFCI